YRRKMKKVLIVDDEAETRRVVQEILLGKGYCVETAADGIEAINKVKSFCPDAVLLDLVMPYSWGIDVLKDIKNISRRTAVIIQSGVIKEGIVELALSAGTDDYIFKPFHLDEMEKHLCAAIENCKENY
ncbi:MAG: response regulator, partial [Syntrophales bacterium]|nr:response regulator [Syntrophales bacterium]